MKKFYPVGMFLLVMAAACKKREVVGPQGPVGPAGPSYKGVVTGHVSQYDQYGARIVYNYVPLQVMLQGYDTVATDSLGYFHFDSVMTGTYKMLVEGEGFGTTMVQNVSIVKDTAYQPVSVSQKPGFDITAFEAKRLDATSEVQLTITVPYDSRPRNVLILASKTPNVSGHPSTYLLSYVKAVPVSLSSTVTMRIPMADLNYARIFYGDIIYFAACSYVQNDASVYEDPYTGRDVFTAIGAPMIDTCLAP